MTNIWRPSQAIRVKVLGLCWRGNEFLAAEIPDDTGRIKGVRPLGGTVEFGESWQKALRREFLEELGTAIDINGPPQVFENIYEHEGMIGHEVIFMADIALLDSTIAARDMIVFEEDNGVRWTARWFDPAQLSKEGTAVFPNGLSEHLARVER